MTEDMTAGRPSLAAPGVLLATWFGTGYLPKAPGTWGSAAALPFAWFILDFSGTSGLLIAVAVVFAVGVWAAADYTARSGMEDPGPVVIDEVAGQWLVLACVPMTLGWFAVAFVLFRLFDVTKPWPVNVMDRNIKCGLGVMLDDIGASIYASASAYGLQMALGAL